jgi:uncharacterized cupin superfamily protein
MAKIFKAADRRFEENPGRKEGFGLVSDQAVVAWNRTDDRSSGQLGAGSLNFDVRRLPPGELSSLYHFHRHAEELFMILEGGATLRTPEGLQVLEKGDIAFFETGAAGAHQLYNHTGEVCVYLDVRTFAGADIAESPDAGRLLVIPTMERFDKASSSDYFEGEPPASEIRKIFETATVAAK